MKMSEEMAVRLHRMMWSDMQKELGDNPGGEERLNYKSRWTAKHFPGEPIASSCWLCEYASSCREPDDFRPYCRYCPIRWPGGHCNATNFSYQKEPISEILALPAKNVANDYEHVAYSYYKYREDLLSKASGIPASSAIADHVKAIREKAVEMEPLKQRNDSLTARHIAVKEYLAKESGLAPDRPVGDHIMQIRSNAKIEKCEEIYGALSEVSGLPKGNWCLSEHVKAIQEKAVEEYFEKTPGAKLATTDVDEAFKQYAKEQKAPIFRALAEESGLDPTAGVKAHINAIYSNGFDDGKDVERERILDKIGEMLKK